MKGEANQELFRIYRDNQEAAHTIGKQFDPCYLARARGFYPRVPIWKAVLAWPLYACSDRVTRSSNSVARLAKFAMLSIACCALLFVVSKVVPQVSGAIWQFICALLFTYGYSGWQFGKDANATIFSYAESTGFIRDGLLSDNDELAANTNHAVDLLKGIISHQRSQAKYLDFLDVMYDLRPWQRTMTSEGDIREAIGRLPDRPNDLSEASSHLAKCQQALERHRNKQRGRVPDLENN